MQETALNKMTLPRQRRRAVTEIVGRPELPEELVKCRSCRSILAVPNNGLVECSCGHAYRWRSRLPDARSKVIEAQP